MAIFTVLTALFNGVLAVVPAFDSSFLIDDGAYSPVLTADGFAVLGRLIVPIDVYGRVLAGAFKVYGAGVLGAAAPVVVGFFNPPPIDEVGFEVPGLVELVFGEVPLGDFAPLDEFNPTLGLGGTLSLDCTFEYFDLVTCGVYAAAFDSDIYFYIPVLILDYRVLVVGALTPLLSFYRVSTIPLSLLISPFVFSI